MTFVRNQRWNMWLRGQGVASVFDPDTILFMNALGIANDNTVYYASTPQEITGAQIWTAVNNFILGSKANGIYGIGWTDVNLATSIIEAYYPAIGGTSARHALNMANLSQNLTFGGSWVHDALGFTGNGVNTFAATGIVPSSNPRIGGDNMVIGIHSRTNQSSNNCNPCRTYMGSRASIYFNQATVWYARNNNFNVIINNSGALSNTTGFDTIQGFNVVRRQGGTYTNFKNGIIVSTNSETTLQPSQSELYLGALNQTGIAYEYVNINWIGCLIANTMSDAQVIAFNSLVSNLNSALNRLP